MRRFSIIVYLMCIIGFTPSLSFALFITPISPEKGTKISEEFVARVKVSEDKGTPFTEAGPLRWVTFIIRDARGVEALRLSLRDNGKGEDGIQNDGIWTSPATIKLSEGEYSAFVVVRKGKSIFRSPKFKFTVNLPKTLPKKKEVKKAENLEKEILREVRQIPSKMKKNLSGLEKQILKTEDALRRGLVSGGSSKNVEYMLGVVIVLIIVGFVMLFWFIKRLRPAVVTQIQMPSREGPITENWKSLFGALETLREQLPEVEGNLTSIFHMHNRYKEGFQKILKDLIAFYENISEIEAIPKEVMGAFRMEVLNILKRMEVEKWAPEVGEIAPDECEKEPAEGEFPYPVGTVIQVVSPGYRIRGNGSFIPLKEPKVKVVPYKAT